MQGQMRKRLIISFFLLPMYALSENVIQCKDLDGHIVFADDKNLCVSDITNKDVRIKNAIESRFNDAVEVSFRYPERIYGKVDNKWKIYYEKIMEESAPDLYNKAIEKLTHTLSQIDRELPIRAAEELRSLKIYLLWGKDSPYGGKKSGMRYVRYGEPENYKHYDPQWEKSKKNGLYENVKDIKGKVIKKAYARKNNLEYFAELQPCIS